MAELKRDNAPSSSRMRWLIALLLLLASVINYVDRQALSVLAPTIQKDLNITDQQYAIAVEAFLLCYGLMYFGSGRLVDLIGARVSEALFLAWWSLSSMLTAIARSFPALVVVRSLLGLGEPGNFTAAAKVTSKWFDPSERSIAVGIYSMGGTLGAAVASPLIAFLALSFGWKAPFVIVGAAGLVLSAAWLLIYREPGERKLGDDQIVRELSSDSESTPRILWWKLLGSRTFLSLLLCRMITDPVWYFYLFWFPKYLQDRRGMTLRDIGSSLWVVFVAADLGSLAGGVFSARLASRGFRPPQARLAVMAIAAVILIGMFSTPLFHRPATVLLVAGIGAFSHMVWMTNVTTLPIDVFPQEDVSTIQGALGAGSSFGGFLSSALIGALIGRSGYNPIFYTMSLVYLVALSCLLPALWHRPSTRDPLHAIALLDERG